MTALAIVGGTLWRPACEPLSDGAIVLRDGRVESVGAATPPRDAETLDATGLWIIPGLVDAHIHFFQSGGLYTRPDIIDLRDRVPYETERRAIRERLPDTFARYQRCGVTSVVDCGGPFWNFEVRELAARTALAPRVSVTGPLVSTYGPAGLQTDDPPIVQCDTPDEARALVRRQLPYKPDFVKIWYILLNRPPESLLPVAGAAIDEAHAAGLRVAVHATELETARAAVQAGADILVHSVFDREVDDAFVELLLRRRVTYVPTLMVVERYRQTLWHTLRLTAPELRWGDPWTISTLFDRFENRPRPPAPAGAANLKRLFDAGVTIAAGTDAGNIGTPHGPAIFRGLEMMVEAGLTASQALACATGGGEIAPGSQADLVLLGADPGAKIDNLADIRVVVRGGRPWRAEEILVESPLDLVQRQVNAYNARHLTAFLETYADDVEIDGLLKLRGKEAMRERYGRLFDENPGLHCEIVRRRVESASTIIDDERVTGRADGVERRARARYVVEDGLIRQVTFLPVE
jgi:imidazolonepropionase-like amidohydrolase